MLNRMITIKALILICSLCLAGSKLCKYPSWWKPEGITAPGDIMLGGIFIIHFGEENRQLFLNEAPQDQSCVRFSTTGFHQAMVMVFSINQVNNNSTLLSNITLGYVIRDDCLTFPKATAAALQFMAQESHQAGPCSFQAVIGPVPSTLSVITSHLLGLSYVPQVSFASICKCLSDKSEFPSFLRTIPSAVPIVSAIVQLVQHFNWLYIGSVAVDDEYGRAGQGQFLKEAERDGICIAFHELQPRPEDVNTRENIGAVIKESKVRVVWLYMAYTSVYPLAEEFLKMNITDKVWIADAPWISSPIIGALRFASIFHGTIGMHNRKGVIPGLQSFLMSFSPKAAENRSERNLKLAPELLQRPEHVQSQEQDSLNDFILKLWEVTFNCTWENGIVGKDFCTNNESLNETNSTFTDVAELRESYSVYTAVNAIAHALHDLHTCKFGQSPFTNGSCPDLIDFEPWQLLFYLRKVHFKNNLGQDVYFDENGDMPSVFDIINWQKDGKGGIMFTVVGRYDPQAPPNEKFILNMAPIVWIREEVDVPRSVCNELCQPGSRKVSYPGKPFCCYDCISCMDGEYSNNTGSEDCIRCPKFYWSTTFHNACIAMPEEYLAFSDPLALVLLAFSLLGIFITIVVGLLLSVSKNAFKMKTALGLHSEIILMALLGCFLWTIALIGRPTDVTCQIRRPMACLLLLLTISCVLVLIIPLSLPSAEETEQNNNSQKYKLLKNWVVLFISLGPQITLSLTWIFVGQTHVNLNTQVHPGIIIVECGGDSPAWAVCNITFLGVMAAICLGLASKAQKLPSAKNEAKFITFSMLTFLLVGLAFIPANSSTQGKFKIATEIFALIAIAYSLLGCIFITKCYSMLFKMK